MRGDVNMVLAAVVLASSCGVSAAQSPGSGMQPEPAKTTTPPTPEPAKAEAPGKAEFPKLAKKNLYAKNDYRGKKAPDFHVEKWLGKDAKAPDRTNKVVLIDFWATWCPPCRAAIPELNEWAHKFKDDLVVIGVSDEEAGLVEVFAGLRDARSDKPEEQRVARMKTKVEYPMAIDTKAQMKSAVGVARIPNVLVIDSTGIVRWQGFPNSSEEKLTDSVLKQIIEADKAQRKSAAKPDAEPKKADAPADPTKK
ncbi:MAG: TlpA family protein disulfide reductase [Phycisphaerales bacterium]|nr:TlpA family protein disulfide reductase [Phycisphaerales bacterium]